MFTEPQLKELIADIKKKKELKDIDGGKTVMYLNQ
jgi:hypothetical protein